MKLLGHKEKLSIAENQHFFAASTSTWATTTPSKNLAQLIEFMIDEGLGFNLFLVPVPYDKGYTINFFQPQVEGTQWLGFIEGKK